MDGSVYANRSKIEVLLGGDFLNSIKAKVVVDFGCGTGAEAIEISQYASKVIGVDIREGLLEIARKNARDNCEFVQSFKGQADVIVAIDSFEHFDDPASILRLMSSMVKPDGFVIASFGPTWYHPLGGHLFSVFPWAHLVFTEKALIRWRSDFRTDGATRFREVEGGLNQMTIKHFLDLVEKSPLKISEFQAVPIRKLKPIASRLTREFTTAIVRCKMVLRPQ
jgi:SAM-dependent methyltransferase